MNENEESIVEVGGLHFRKGSPYFTVRTRKDPRKPKLYKASRVITDTIAKQLEPITPEENMVLHIIWQAVDDYICPERKLQVHELEDARHFIESERLDGLCVTLGVDPDYVRGLIETVRQRIRREADA